MIAIIENQIKTNSLWGKFSEMNAIQTRENKKPHQTFYHYFRPIGIFCRFLGVLPLKNLHDRNVTSLEFAYASMPTVYTIVLFIMAIGLTAYFCDYDNFKENVANFDSASLWGCVTIVLMIVKSLVYCFFCVIRSKRYVKLIKLLDLFDREVVSVFKNKIIPCKTDNAHAYLKKTVIPFAIGSVAACLALMDFLSFCHFVMLQIGSDDIYGWWYTSFTVLGIWQVFPLYLYVYFAFAIKDNFKCINKICTRLIPVEKMYSKPEEHRAPSNFKDILRNIRLLYVLMGDIVKNLNGSYGIFLAIDQFYVIVTFVVNMYVFFFTKNQDVNLLYFVIVNGSVILVMVFVSHDINYEVSFQLLIS